MVKEVFWDHNFQEYMTVKDCSYCQDSANYTEIAKKPQVVVKCNTCGLYRLYPRMNHEGQIAMFKRYNEEKIDIAKWKNKLVNIDRHTLREVEKIKQIFPQVFQNGRVLDVGCAEGAFDLALKRAGANPTGIEPKGDLVELGKEEGLDLHVGRFELGAGGIPSDLENHSFDLICFRGTLYYMPNLHQTFDLLNTYLKPGGGLYINISVATSIYFFFISKDFSQRLGLNAASMPTKKSLEYILNREGYKIHKISYYWPGYALNVPKWVSKSFLHRIIGMGGRFGLSLFAYFIRRGDRVVAYASKK